MKEYLIKLAANYACLGIEKLVQNSMGTKREEQMYNIEENRRQNDFKREILGDGLGAAVDVVNTVVDTVSGVIIEKEKSKSEFIRNRSEVERMAAQEEIYEKRLIFEKEMEELEKDRDLQRRKDVLITIQNYQTEVTNAVNDSMMILASMPLELRKRAADMLLEEQKKYTEFNSKWEEDALKKLDMIQVSFANNERVKIKLEDRILNGMDEMLKMAERTIKQMEQNILEINENALMLSQKGEMMVESRLNSMQLEGVSRYMIDKSDS